MIYIRSTYSFPRSIPITVLLFLILSGNIYAQTEVVIDSLVTIDSISEEPVSTSISRFDKIISGVMPLPGIRRVPDSVVRKLQQEDVFWYANEEWAKPRIQQSKRKTFIEAEWFKTLMWMLIVGAFMAAIIWYLASTNFTMFRKKTAVFRNSKDEFESENIFEIHYDTEINKAVEEKNFRLATRLMFLQLLKHLSERNIIQYKQDRTNFDYLMQLSNTGFYRDFFRLTRNYEFAWYGKHDPGAEGFSIISNEFKNFNTKLHLS